MRLHTGEKATRIKTVCYELNCSGEGLETCHICSKIFTHTYALNVHMKIHSKENNYMCHKCKKVFQNASTLYQHVLGHSDNEFQCQQCRSVRNNEKVV